MSLSVDHHPDRCGRCGGLTRSQTIKGLRAQVCSRCEVVTMDLHTLQRLTGASLGATYPSPQPMLLDPSGPSTFPTPGGGQGGASSVPLAIPPPHPAARPPRSRGRAFRTWLVLLLAGGAVLAALATIPAVFAVYQGFQSMQAAPTPDPGPRLDAVVPATPPQPEPPAEAEAPPEEGPEEAEATPTEAPAPSPPSPAPSMARLLQEGWDRVEGSPSRAASTFKRALDQHPDHPEANYGYGYALLKQGDATGARPHLCVALKGGDPETEREVRSLLAQRGLTCQ